MPRFSSSRRGPTAPSRATSCRPPLNAQMASSSSAAKPSMAPAAARFMRPCAVLALVVVPDLLLLDRDGGDIRERGASLVGRAKVPDERRHGLAVVHDGGFDTLHEGADALVGHILLGEVGGAARRGEERSDQSMKDGRRHSWVRLAKPEPSPRR